MGSNARFFANIVASFCRDTWPDDFIGMESTCASNWAGSELFNTRSSGSHKYIPVTELNKALGLQDGSGVYGYISFKDDSYCLLTSMGNGLAIWESKDPSTAEWLHKPLTEKDWDVDVGRYRSHLNKLKGEPGLLMGPKALRNLQEKWGERGSYFV